MLVLNTRARNHCLTRLKGAAVILIEFVGLLLKALFLLSSVLVLLVGLILLGVLKPNLPENK